MAQSKCLNCDHTSFETAEVHTALKGTGKKHLVSMIQCSSCGGVVGVMEPNDISKMLFQIADRMGLQLSP